MQCFFFEHFKGGQHFFQSVRREARCFLRLVDLVAPVLAFIFIKQVIVIFSCPLVKFPLVLKRLCFAALVAAQLIPLALCQKIFPTDLALPEAKGIRTEKGELNRWIKATNRLMQDVRKKIKALFVWMAEVKEELSKPQTPNLADLLIAYYNQRNVGAWSNKARTGNLKQFAEAVNYLTENKLLTLEDLQERLSSVSEEFEALSGSMKKKSARIKELQELIREGENYQRLKPVHTELNNIKFKKQREKFETSHDAELRLFYAARRILKEKLDGKPLPSGQGLPEQPAMGRHRAYPLRPASLSGSRYGRIHL